MTQMHVNERNIGNVRNLIEEVINARRLDLCERYLAADRIDHQNYGMPEGAADGHDGFRRVLGPFLEAFPDLKLKIQFIVHDERKLVVYMETSGTHCGPFMGAAPTGRRFKVNGVDIFEFNQAGLVSHHWGVFDTFGMMTQLGLTTAPTITKAA